MFALELRDYVVRPTLKKIGLWSVEAEQLVIGTIYVESNARHLKQIAGPALGIIQMEPNTHNDIWENYLDYRPSLRLHISSLASAGSISTNYPEPDELITNLAYAVAMCRIHYFRRPESLPKQGDIDSMARFWKRFYNTHLGHGDVCDFVDRFPKEIL